MLFLVCMSLLLRFSYNMLLSAIDSCVERLAVYIICNCSGETRLGRLSMAYRRTRVRGFFVLNVVRQALSDLLPPACSWLLHVCLPPFTTSKPVYTLGRLLIEPVLPRSDACGVKPWMYLRPNLPVAIGSSNNVSSTDCLIDSTD